MKLLCKILKKVEGFLLYMTKFIYTGGYMRQPISGVYKIVCVKNNKIYIGSSVDIINRWWDHKARLRSDKHANQYLQHAWNKYGEANFLFDIVEICGEERRIDREQYWMGETRCHIKQSGFNISKEAAGSDSMAKEYVVTQPDGKEVTVRNLTKFCRSHGLSPSGLSHVAFGRASQYKGWLCRISNITNEQWKLTRRNSKFGGGWKGKWRITHPDGRDEVVESLTKFCGDHELSQGNMVEVSKGTRRQHLGYKCVRDEQ
jgi:group I intron endonuclease